MSERFVDIEDRGSTRLIVLNRPDKMNALNTAMTQQLLDALRAADLDDGVRAVVLAGNGRSFCAGADLGEFAELTPDHPERVSARAKLTSDLHELLPSLRTPIVAAIHGAAVGGGAGLAIGSDLVVAANDLRFGYPELKHSIVPAIVMTSLVRNVGRKAAFDLVATGRLIGADEARDLGAINHVVEPGAERVRAMEIAEALCAVDPRAMAATKSLFYTVSEATLDDAVRAGREMNERMRGFRKGSER